jgi:hypothetical protein
MTGQYAAETTEAFILGEGVDRRVTTVPRRIIQRVELSTQRRSFGQGAKKGALYGAGVAVAALAVGTMVQSINCDLDCRSFRVPVLVILGVPLVAISSLTGAVILGVQRDKWEAVELREPAP